MGIFPWGFFQFRGETEMSYRKVGYLEQCWYIIKFKLRELFRRR